LEKLKMNVKEINEVFGKQLRQLNINDFEKRTFNLNRFIENGIL